MSYERAWVIGVFGNALIKRHGGAPEHPAGDRIRVARTSGYKMIALRMHAVLKIAHVIYQRGTPVSLRNARTTIPANLKSTVTCS